ncbi:MAG: hypothetical protein JGK17_10400 [Microcoleus sp. PH2017_10_PVI_O_A]|uniref:hypothetical protein n=1 Tax=unclassified Microcoleus TaxID=2642155 RepID=UPI001DCB66A6|nr:MULTISPECIES: hypothetical protein [unclassified Microcoleus]TAE78376.1 MAG: hypothetical protein EAZ83_24870 [Oscillatoriales cyanobacterium]MCC3405983.1 hypothetical protein [Microcoleus sp. PH2017_10_PVI_O_A]MCC3460012.1 hypothetical protein [Microcoleus sp. PH2017_11_PCY_U_A]MCC3478512.1 hypothetical protein [Microcoleus sp. PH2017_12_PCY_D_A]MCC3531114.1 hypothetical protein [Microcoleus sp. PH2017_21_RUC_O_A]
MFETSEKLLYVISAQGKVSWENFKKYFEQLSGFKTGEIEENTEKKSLKYPRFETMRALNSLGHCDWDFSGDRSKSEVYAAPPVLVRLPCAGFPQAILAGARSPVTIAQLSEACQSVGHHIKLEVTEQSSELGLIPKRVALQAEDVGELRAIGNLLKIPFIETPSAWSLLHFAASIDDYLATLEWSKEPELNWQSKTFDPISLQFQSIKETDRAIRLSQYSHPSRNIKVYYLWQDGMCAEIDLDWGRYAVLKALRRNVLIYDKRRFTMAVPASANLPRLLERALTLCSGCAAKYEKMPRVLPQIQGFNLFSAIPPQIAEITAAKLGHTLLQQSLDIT